MNRDHPTLAKVRKLLAKAEDPSVTPAEAELFTTKAAELIAEYGIDQALLEYDDGDRAAIGSRIIVLDRPFAADKADLLTTVAIRTRCACVCRTQRRSGQKEHSVHVFGHDPDLVRMEMLFTSLLVQSATALAQVPVPVWEHKAAFRRSWMAGFRQAISDRMRAAEGRARAVADDLRSTERVSTEIVLADRDARVRDAMDAAYPHLVRGRARSLSGSGGAAGYAAGEKADLGGGRIPGGRAMLSR